MSTRLSRRSVVRGAGAVVGGLATGGIVAGRGAAASRAVQAPAVISRRSQSGKEITLAIQAFAHEAMKPVLATWEEKTGNTVKLESGPVTGAEMITKYAPAFQAETSPVDVISDADDSSPTFMRAGWLEPLDDVIPQATWDDFPETFQGQIETWHSFDGKRYRVPHEFAIGYTFYRKDLFNAQNLAAPTTWDEVVGIGQEMTSAPMFGTLDGLIKPGLLYVYVAYLAAQSGGDVFAFDEATAEALQFAYDLIYTHKVMPETALSMDYAQQNEEYMQDHVAFMRQWPFFWDVVRGNTEWFADDKAAIALPPAGPAGAKSWWGGWGFSVPAFAPNKEEALDLVAHITSPENAPILAQGQSWFVMPRTSILEAMGNEGLAVHMQEYAAAEVPSPRPFHPKVAEAQSVVEDAAALFLTNQSSLADALETGKERLAQLG